MTGAALSSGSAERAVASGNDAKSTRAGLRRHQRGDSAGHFLQVGNSDQPVLADEREGLIAALGLCHAQNPMIASIVNGDGPLIIDRQAAAVGSRHFGLGTAPSNPAGCV
jgi:hypothetical protein